MLANPSPAITQQTTIRLLVASVFLIAGSGFARNGHRGLRDGSILMGKGRTARTVYRDRQPALFWISIILNWGFVVLAIFAIAMLIFMPGSAK